MVEEWMPPLQLPLSPAQFVQLPRNAAFNYTYHDDLAWIYPRPRYYHALLALPGLEVEGAAAVKFRRFAPRDWPTLTELFAEAFAAHQPFAGAEASARRIAAREALERTAHGGDGPWIERASLLAVDADRILGAIMVTLLPRLDPTHWDSYTWEEPPPANCIERRLGRPHLTWVFVDPQKAGRGVGCALLQASARALVAMGFDELASTFMIGNESSMLWHWRAGFRLLSYPGSRRRGE